MATNVNRNRIFHLLNLETLESHPAPVIPDDHADNIPDDDSPTLAAIRKLLRNAESIHAIKAALDAGGSGVTLNVNYSSANVEQLITKTDEVVERGNGHLVSANFSIPYTKFHDATIGQDARHWAIEQLTTIAARATAAAEYLQRRRDGGPQL